MTNTRIGPTVTYVRSVAENCLQEIFTESMKDTHSERTVLDYFRPNSKAIEKAINEYFGNKDKWKRIFNFSLEKEFDRHKIAAITSHYLIRNFPLIKRGKFYSDICNQPLVLLMDELIVLEVALNIMKFDKGIFDTEDRDKVHPTIIKLFRNHKSNKDPEDFVRGLAVTFYQIEKEHLQKCQRPL